jgi:hypothetical protein
MQKRGRPKALIETKQVAVRLPVAMVEEFGPYVSEQIRERLARSLFDEARDPHLRKLAGQIEEIAKDVHGATGFEWHSDQTAHHIFIEALRLLFANLPVPKAKKSKVALDPAAAAAIIYNRYAATVRELERTRKTGMRTPLSQLLENDDG